jgi:hypothetical protein
MCVNFCADTLQAAVSNSAVCNPGYDLCVSTRCGSNQWKSLHAHDLPSETCLVSDRAATTAGGPRRQPARACAQSARFARRDRPRQSRARAARTAPLQVCRQSRDHARPAHTVRRKARRRQAADSAQTAAIAQVHMRRAFHSRFRLTDFITLDLKTKITLCFCDFNIRHCPCSPIAHPQPGRPRSRAPPEPSACKAGPRRRSRVRARRATIVGTAWPGFPAARARTVFRV